MPPVDTIEPPRQSTETPVNAPEAPPTWQEVSETDDYKALPSRDKVAALSAWTLDTRNFLKTQPIPQRAMEKQSNEHFVSALDSIRKNDPNIPVFQNPHEALENGYAPEAMKLPVQEISTVQRGQGLTLKNSEEAGAYLQSHPDLPKDLTVTINDDGTTTIDSPSVAPDFWEQIQTPGGIGAASAGVSKASAQTAAGLSTAAVMQTPNVVVSGLTGPAAPVTYGALNILEFLGGYYLSGKGIEGASENMKDIPAISQLRKDVEQNPQAEAAGETAVMLAQGKASLSNLSKIGAEQGVAQLSKHIAGATLAGGAAEAVRPYVEQGLAKVISESPQEIPPATLQSIAESMAWGALLSGIGGEKARAEAVAKRGEMPPEIAKAFEEYDAANSKQTETNPIEVQADAIKSELPATAAALKEIEKIPLKEVSPEKEILDSQEIQDVNSGNVEGVKVNADGIARRINDAAIQESSLTPAIKTENRILRSESENPSHANIMEEASKKGIDATEGEKGFVDQDGNFVSRQDAAKRALDEGIIDQQAFDNAMNREGDKKGLHSEDFKSQDSAAKISKIGRVAEDVFGEQSTGLGITPSSLYESEGVKKYAQSWVDRAKSLFDVAKGIRDHVQKAEVRDTISATIDAADNAAGYLANQVGNRVKLAGGRDPKAISEMQQKAATFVRQAFSKEEMLGKLEQVAQKDKKYSAIYTYAKEHWNALEKIAKAAKESTDAVHDELIRSGINVDYRENYVKGAYFDPQRGKVILDETKGKDSASGSFKKQKVFNDYAEAILAGYEPKELNLSKLTESAVLQQLRVANRAKWAESLSELKMPDGSPVAVEPVKQVKIGTPSVDELKVDDAGNVITPKETKSTSLVAPEGYQMVQVANGQFLAINENIAPLIKKLTEASHIWKVASQSAAFVKHNILVFDIFHASRFAQMQMAFEGAAKPSYRKGLALLEFSNADLAHAVKQGKVTPEEAAWAKEHRPVIEILIKHGLNAGRISDALFAESTPLIPGAKQANHFIFQKLSRGIITQSAAYAFERNAKLHPEWSAEKLARYTAKEVNTYYRNLGNQGLLKSKTFQDLSRILIFAPQWIEGMARSEARGYGQAGKAFIPGKNFGKFGNISKGMGTGLVAYFALAQIVNLITRGKPTWDNDEPGHKFDAWIPDDIEGSKGYFISPLSVFAEYTHDAMKYSERGMEPMEVFSQIGANKLHPIVHSFRDVVLGRDFYGKKLHGWERFSQGAKDVAPIPMASKAAGYKGGIERQLLSTGGIKAVPAPSATSSVYQLADTFLREQHIEKPDFSTSPYSDMRKALRDGDLQEAKKQYDELLKTKSAYDITKAMNKYQNAPFTGAVKTENAFRKSLDRGELDLYNAAYLEKDEIVKNFRKIRQIKK